MPELPGDERRLRESLEEDQPGAPPGYILDPEDEHTGSHSHDNTGCAEEPPEEIIDPDGDPLARGFGEDDLEEEDDGSEAGLDRVTE